MIWCNFMARVVTVLQALILAILSQFVECCVVWLQVILYVFILFSLVAVRNPGLFGTFLPGLFLLL